MSRLMRKPRMFSSSALRNNFTLWNTPDPIIRYTYSDANQPPNTPMNLSKLETSVDRTILQRGQGYLKFVDSLEETEPEFWQAYVEGSDTYDVEVQLDGDKVTDWSCTCPYDHGPVCKHVVAVLLNIRNQQQQHAASPVPVAKTPGKREQLEPLLTTLKREELEDYIRQLLHGNRNLLDKFLLRFQRTVPNGENLAKQYQQQFNSLARQYSRHGFIDYDEVSSFADEVHELLDTLSSSASSPADTADACFAIADGIAGIANNIDDSNGELGDLMYGVKDVLAKAYPQLPSTGQSRLFLQVLAAHFDERYDDYGLEDVFADLLETWATDNSGYQETYLQALDQRIRTSADWRRDGLLRQKLALLKTWGKEAELETIAAAHMDIPDFREIFVQQAINAKDFAKARQLVQEGIRLAEQQKQPGIVQRWHARLLEMAYQLDDKPAIRHELEWLFQNKSFQLEHYRQLKATYPAEDWPSARQRLYAMIPEPRGYDAARACLLEEDNDLPALYELITKTPDIPVQSHALFKKYAPLLATAFPQEITVAYASQICDYLHSNTGRHAYEQVIHELKTLSTMPNGKNMAANLVADFRHRYKTRKAMLEMFAKAFGNG